MTLTIRSIITVGLFLSACAGSAPQPTTPESTAPVAAEPSAPEAWSDDLSQAQKAAFMKAYVVPGMAPLFQAFDATKHADFGCATCHGPEGKDPKAFLPKLIFKDNQLTAFAEQPEMAKFMAEQVSPKMASILGKAPYDPATHTGFGCTGCHAVSM